MNLLELIQQIPIEILQRGQSYYDNGHLLGLTQGSKGVWYAEVAGSYGDYNVNIQIDPENKVRSYDCNCPFEGPLCKHIAAVVLALENKNGLPLVEGQEQSWSKLIQDAKPKELKQFMLDFGLKNHDFRHQVELAFSKPASDQFADNIPYYESKVNGIFENYDDRGFIDYRSGRRAMNDVHQFLHKLDDYYSKGNLNEAFCIAAAVATEGVNAIQHMDDSSGECGGAVSDSFVSISKVLNSTESSALKTKIFDWLHEQVQNTDYNDYGMGDELEPLYFESAKSLNKMDLAYQFIDDKIKELDKEDGWNKKYYTEFYLSQKIELLQSEGKTEDAEAIVDQYLHFDKIRKMKVDKALLENDFEKTITLISEGIEIAQKENLPGIVHQWKDQLLALYEKENETNKYNQLARELFVENTSSIKYFIAYKQSSADQDWEVQRNKLIAELKAKNQGYYRGVCLDDLANVFIEEQMIDELFGLVSSSNSIQSVIKYTDHLKVKYAQELLKYYKASIQKEAVQTGRNAYISLVEYLKKMDSLEGGKYAARELKKELLDKYKNRPAMKEEFKRLKFD